eukprot:7398238-Pyramimonas_sp.AAC.1
MPGEPPGASPTARPLSLAMRYEAALCYDMLCYAMLCYAALCYAMFDYVMICYVMPMQRCTMLSQTKRS